MIDLRRCIGTLVLAWCLIAGCGAAQQRAPAPSTAARSLGVAQAGVFAARGLTLLEQGDHVRAEQYLMLALRAGYDEHALIDPLLTSCIASNRLRAALSHADRYLARNATSARVLYVKEALERALAPSEVSP
jgi:Tfp pilus assembly protein PilF